MLKELTQFPEVHLIGLSARTNNKFELEAGTGKIGTILSRFWDENVSEKIPHLKPGSPYYAVYTDYASDEFGDYTYFFGKEVTHIENVPEDLTAITLPSRLYQKFTTDKGERAQVVIGTWQEIWEMSQQEMGGQRAYLADFEIYDERANDPDNSVVDIYIGIKS